MEAVPIERQLYEIKHEFEIEAIDFRDAKDPLERESVLAHINALLDAYLDLWPEMMDGRGSE